MSASCWSNRSAGRRRRRAGRGGSCRRSSRARRGRRARWTASSTTRAASSSTVRSPGATTARPPARCTTLAVSSSGPGRRPLSATLPPSAARPHRDRATDAAPGARDEDALAGEAAHDGPTRECRAASGRRPPSRRTARTRVAPARRSGRAPSNVTPSGSDERAGAPDPRGRRVDLDADDRRPGEGQVLLRLDDQLRRDRHPGVDGEAREPRDAADAAHGRHVDAQDVHGPGADQPLGDVQAGDHVADPERDVDRRPQLRARRRSGSAGTDPRAT